MKVNSITLGFANLETVDLPIECFQMAEAINISKSNMLINNDVWQYRVCDEVLLGLKEEAAEHQVGKTDAISRVMSFRDITYITFNYANGRHESIYVPYSDGYENTFEEVTVCDDDVIYVRIAETATDWIKERGIHVTRKRH